MIALLNNFWPWLIIGALFLVWGVSSLHLNLSQWSRIFFNIIFNNISDQTKSEKRQVLNTPLDDAMSSNLGCTLVFLGAIFLFIGVIRWLS